MELTTRRLNRAVLARQLLLRRTTLPLVRALERVGGIQAQYAPSTYIGLWSRLEDFRFDALTRALEQRRAVQATLMRSTIHVVSARDYGPFAAGIRRDLGEWWLRAHRRLLGDADLGAATAAVVAALGDGVLSRSELLDVVRPFAPDRPTAVLNGIGVELVRVPPSGTWERRRADLYATAESWLGPANATEDEGRDLLLTRYLAAFGPATLNEAADWAGVRVTTLKPSLERVRVRRLADEQGRELLDLPRRPLPDEDTPAPPRFLPTWDATLLVHARRTQILPERFRPLVFDTKTPHSFPTFLVDGAVAGRWKVEATRTKATLVVEPFERLPRAALAELEDEGERLVRVHEPLATSYAVRTAKARA